MAESANAGGGIGIFGATFIVFLVLKLTGYIDWSWWWVTAPLWGSILLAVAILLLVGIGWTLYHLINELICYIQERKM